MLCEDNKYSRSSLPNGNLLENIQPYSSISHFYTCMTDKTVTVANLYKSFGEHTVFEDTSLNIEAGSVFGLVGLNGTGKTTFIRLLLGLLCPCRGNVRVLGFDPWLHNPEYYRRLGVILEHDGFAGNLTVERNLRVFAEARGVPWSQVETYVEGTWADTFLQKELRGSASKVKHLSRGQKMQCAICRAFLPGAEVFFFDEPTVALDVDAIDHFYSLVRSARDRGATVLISSHQLSAIQDLCDTIGMLHDHGIHILTADARKQKSHSWLVRCAGEDKYRAIIETACGATAEYYNGCWHFAVADAGIVVPKIVSGLAAAGCDIAEVRPDADAIKDKMRTLSRGPGG
jgi:ABC-2 type transport system ATP-binding protein